MSTTINRVNILMRQGATFRWHLELQNPDFTPLDLTGCHVVMQVRRSYRVDTVWLEASTYGGEIVVDALAGTITIHIADEATATLPSEEAVYDVLLLWPNGDVTRIREGNVRIALGVTREWQT